MDSTTPPKKHLLYFFLVCALVFSAQVIPRWWSDSLVMDEEWNLTAAYYYWTQGDVYTSCGTTAPGALCAVPLLFMQDLEVVPDALFDWRTRSLGLLFMYNPERLEAITVLSRAVDWLIGLAIGYLLYRSVRAGPRPLGFAALALWAFDPTLLAFSGTAKTDLSVAFWFLLCVLAFKKAQTAAKPLPFAGAGALAGLTSATRYNGILVLPVLFALEAVALFEPGQGLQALRRRFLPWLSALGGFLLSVAYVYLPGTALAHWQWRFSPWYLFYFNLRFYLRQRPDVSGLSVIFANHTWPPGSWLNFPYHFFFKNTLAFLALLLLAALLLSLRIIRIPPWVWVPPTVYLGLFWALDHTMNIRHALPAIPFLILTAAYAFQWVWEMGADQALRWPRVAVAALLLGHGASVAAAFPHHIAYANELLDAGKKYTLLYSFNWNLGQDMKRLAELGRERGWKRVKLLTAQRTDPYFYGLSWQPWTVMDVREPQPGTVYVVDPSIFSDFPSYTKLFQDQGSWVDREGMKKNIGGTLYYYETPGTWDPSSRDDSPVIDSFPYYKSGVQPYLKHAPPDSWIEMPPPPGQGASGETGAKPQP